MRITTKPLEMIVIEDLPNLDPVRVVLENFEPGKGRIIIVCYDAAWVSYWGAMSGDSVQDFFIRCNSDYLADNLSCASSLSRNARHRYYLIRVVEAVQAALRSMKEAA